jgi:alpha-amylase/alpha-mannosidase (GH57 family)
MKRVGQLGAGLERVARMPDRPVAVAFLWHMHQPWYGDPHSGHLRLPWVRLHALKDYLDMVAVLDDHPEVHVTFNLVPSLLAQIQLYLTGAASDDVVELSRREAGDLTDEDRRFWLRTGFQINWERHVDPFPRYRDLLERRGRESDPAAWAGRLSRFETQDWRDLQVRFNLAWCGWELRSEDPLVKALLLKGQDYTEDDKQSLLDRLDQVLASVLPRYRAAAERGQIEIATSPYYHPILPLLCHFPDARAAMPQVRLPGGAIDAPEDAAAQLRRGRELCGQLLGAEPVGLWPSEGSVSTRALGLAAEAGFRWAATDEHILALSLQRQADPSGQSGRRPRGADLVGPHRHAGLALFFRHHRLSDRIGFDYASWDPRAAAADLLSGIEQAAAGGGGAKNPVVSIILDGENCWEYYARNGSDFLHRLYDGLASHPRLKAVTFSEYLAASPEPPSLDYLFPGSWINHDFYIWAGHREDQRAWELLFAARAALLAAADGLAEETRRQAFEHLYIAEGSDWYWWYGDDHSSADDEIFDALFRGHVRRIWELLGATPPAVLDEPIKGRLAPAPLARPVAPFTPVLDGCETHFFEWRAAGSLGGPGPAGAMSRGADAGVLRRVRFGYDRERLYLAIDLRAPASARLGSDAWVLELTWSADGRAVSLKLPAPGRAGRRTVDLEPGGLAAEVAAGELLEVGLPRAALPTETHHATDLVVTLWRGGQAVERWPGHGAYEFPLPDEAAWQRDWLV